MHQVFFIHQNCFSFSFSLLECTYCIVKLFWIKASAKYLCNFPFNVLLLVHHSGEPGALKSLSSWGLTGPLVSLREKASKVQ